ncbi:MOSC domain-containing protein [Neobacillus mesonae]|uniref:MOSC domain-containing protein n=1 Tax=Neobacillus mesonae TaxID=1193713 RepID=UPI002E217504|nr:MOSC domain-containing protein [Neobacillus mesonae]MED4205471.1 MOSC domain-containing protein [Neobacillus mesonae]
MAVKVGTISSITRYPVKSLAGEPLDSCQIETYGLHGDRFCAFYDAEKTGWESFITARQIPNMLAYKASLLNEEITVVSPDGREFRWDEALLTEIQPYYPKKISMTSVQAPHPVTPELLSVDTASILIVTDTTIRKLEKLWGERLDARRFRPNFIVAVEEESINEKDWIGKRLSIGNVELQVDQFCERCAMITIDPETLVRDLSLLKKVYDEMNMHFGVYASVKKTGQVKVGDQLLLIEETE